MRTSRLLPLLLLLAALSLAACGDDSDSETGGGPEGTATAPAETTSEAEDEEYNESEAEDEEYNESGAEDDEYSEATEDKTAPSGEAVRSAKVEIDDFAYEPATVTIAAGGKVTWVNRDAEEHTATLDDGSYSTGDLAEGKLKSQSFKQPGNFTYHCEIHPEMTGTVEVVKSG